MIGPSHQQWAMCEKNQGTVQVCHPFPEEHLENGVDPERREPPGQHGESSEPGLWSQAAYV